MAANRAKLIGIKNTVGVGGSAYDTLLKEYSGQTKALDVNLYNKNQKLLRNYSEGNTH